MVTPVRGEYEPGEGSGVTLGRGLHGPKMPLTSFYLLH